MCSSDLKSLKMRGRILFSSNIPFTIFVTGMASFRLEWYCPSQYAASHRALRRYDCDRWRKRCDSKNGKRPRKLLETRVLRDSLCHEPYHRAMIARQLFIDRCHRGQTVDHYRFFRLSFGTFFVGARSHLSQFDMLY